MAYDDDDVTTDETTDKPQWRKDLEKQAKDGRKALEDLESMRRQMALRDAGIDLGSPQGRMFAEAYKGEANVDAVKAKAAEFDLALPGTAKPEATAEQVDAEEKFSQASAGAGQQTEMDAALGAFKDWSPYLPSSNGHTVLDPQGKDKILDVLRANGVTIVDENPSGTFQIPGTTPVNVQGLR